VVAGDVSVPKSQAAAPVVECGCVQYVVPSGGCDSFLLCALAISLLNSTSMVSMVYLLFQLLSI
jgi:hypothetical protein